MSFFAPSLTSPIVRFLIFICAFFSFVSFVFCTFLWCCISGHESSSVSNTHFLSDSSNLIHMPGAKSFAPSLFVVDIFIMSSHPALIGCYYRAMAGSLFSRKFVPEVHHVFVQVLSKYANLCHKILCFRIHDTDFPTIFLNWVVVKILYNFSFISAVD